MYSLQLNIDRIMQITQSKDLSIHQMLKNAGLSTSIIDNMKRGRLPSVDKIYDIADYLDCSVDYLLGRSNNPEKQSITNNVSSLINGNNTVVQGGNSANITVHNNDTPKQEISISKQAAEIIRIYENLDARKQMKLFSTALELESQK